LRTLGATVIECPVLAFAPPQSWIDFDTRAARFAPGDWIAFTSATALRWTLHRFGQIGRSPASLAAAHIAALGRGTAKAVIDAGLPVRLTPESHFQSEGLLEALLAALPPGEAVWVPRAEQGREALVNGLRQAGHPVDVTPVYRTVASPQGLGSLPDVLETGGIDWIVFTSSSTVTHFLDQLPPPPYSWQDRVRIACLGRITAETVRQHGLTVDVLPEQQDIEGVVAALAQAAPSIPPGAA
jgi:uroporphyrinogen-III synthase